MSNETNEIIYEGLKARCTDLQRGRFIMSNHKIYQLLRYVASYELFTDYMTACKAICNFEGCYGDAAGSTQPAVFRMPTEDYKIIVLVTGMFYSFDRGKIDFLGFLKKYFPGSTIDESFDVFCLTVLRPYCEAFENALSKERPHFEDQSEDCGAPRLAERVVETITPLLIGITETVLRENSGSRKQEYLDVLEGFCYLMETGNTKLMKAMWIGLKNTFAGYRSVQSALKAIQDVLENYSVI